MGYGLRSRKLVMQFSLIVGGAVMVYIIIIAISICIRRLSVWSGSSQVFCDYSLQVNWSASSSSVGITMFVQYRHGLPRLTAAGGLPLIGLQFHRYASRCVNEANDRIGELVNRLVRDESFFETQTVYRIESVGIYSVAAVVIFEEGQSDVSWFKSLQSVRLVDPKAIFREWFVFIFLPIVASHRLLPLRHRGRYRVVCPTCKYHIIRHQQRCSECGTELG